MKKIICIILSATLLGCNNKPTVDPPTLEACPSIITIGPGNSYTPAACSLKTGIEITIQSEGSHPLTGTGAGQTIIEVTAPQKLIFTQAGTFNYNCKQHGGVGTGMSGKIIVTAP
jgi:plastocyanin